MFPSMLVKKGSMVRGGISMKSTIPYLLRWSFPEATRAALRFSMDLTMFFRVKLERVSEIPSFPILFLMRSRYELVLWYIFL